MVTARVEELDRLLGLEIGADDYICKPFSPREVVARVRAVLRRARTNDTETEQSVPALVIDEDAMRVCVGGKPVELTRTEYRVLHLLARRPVRVYSRAQILDLAYDEEQDVTDRAVDSHVKNIRRKISAAGGGEPIQSVYGIGYRFEA
jgi:two-component system response regulator BaeR